MRAFSLLELLVVVAIIAVLAAVIFPVFSQAKAAAKATACISQDRQVGMAMSLYSSDNDDGAPAAGEDESNNNGGGELNADSWTETVEPYANSRLIYRCPIDDSVQWDALVDARQTSYGLNTYFAPNHPPFFGFKLSNVGHPSECVLLAELADAVTEDHFSPMFWGDPPHCRDVAKQEIQWDALRRLPKTIELARHLGGSNYLFVDLHTKKMHFAQLWQQVPGSQSSRDSFDPER